MYFPVLNSKAQAQYPAAKFLESCHAEARSPGGHLWRSAAETALVRRWVLRFEGLTDAEARALVSLYEWCRGGWRTFSFADPMSNLLRWSEDIRQEAWVRNPWLTITATEGVAGQPAEFLIVNAGASPGRIWQEVDVAPGADLCFSCEAKGGALKLRLGEREAWIMAGESWAQTSVTAESSGGPQRVELELEAGMSVRVRRIQAEIQRVPSQYQGTFERGGIYPNTRFAEGGLRIISVAPDENQLEVLLESPGEVD
jgi:hypothetical protein